MSAIHTVKVDSVKYKTATFSSISVSTPFVVSADSEDLYIKINDSRGGITNALNLSTGQCVAVSADTTIFLTDVLVSFQLQTEGVPQSIDRCLGSLLPKDRQYLRDKLLRDAEKLSKAERYARMEEIKRIAASRHRKVVKEEPELDEIDPEDENDSKTTD